jgi:hypothetical protein
MATDLSTPELPAAGERVRVRRYEVQGEHRELVHDHEGTVGMVDRYGFRLDPEPGYIAPGAVFLGCEHQGTAMYLITEIELMPDGN